MADSQAFLSFVKSLFGSSSEKINSISGEGQIDYVDVDSTCLSDVTYNNITQTMTVTFKESGAMYNYFQVAPSDFEALVQAGSVGGMYNGIIKYEHGYLRIS